MSARLVFIMSLIALAHVPEASAWRRNRQGPPPVQAPAPVPLSQMQLASAPVKAKTPHTRMQLASAPVMTQTPYTRMQLASAPVKAKTPHTRMQLASAPVRTQTPYTRMQLASAPAKLPVRTQAPTRRDFSVNKERRFIVRPLQPRSMEEISNMKLRAEHVANLGHDIRQRQEALRSSFMQNQKKTKTGVFFTRTHEPH